MAMACKLTSETDYMAHLEVGKSPSVTANTQGSTTKMASSDHEGREKIDELDADQSGSGVGQGRRGQELSIKSKEVLNSSRVEANNSGGSPQLVDSVARRSKKGQQKKRKTDDDTASGSKTEAAVSQMRIKRKKMATRQSAAKHSSDAQDQDDESKSAMDVRISTPSLSESASPRRNSLEHVTRPKHEAITMEERRCANKEKKRKLSSSSSTPDGDRLAKQQPTSAPCQHRGRKPQPTTRGSSSAPASPAAETDLIRSRRSSPAIISISSVTTGALNTNGVGKPILDGQNSRSASSPATSDFDSTKAEMNMVADGDSYHASDHKSKRESPVPASDSEQGLAAKKLKMSPNHQDDLIETRKETAIPSSISATVTALVPVYDPSREKPQQHDAGTWVRTVGTSMEAECFGPCEPGTAVTLEGTVWNETKGGILVVNVTWRGKAYVGSLLDCTKYDWAPPPPCDSPSNSENDSPSSNGPFAHWTNSHHRSSKGGHSNGNGRGRKGQNAKRHQNIRHLIAANHATNAAESNSEQDQNGERRIKKPATISSTILEPDAPVLFQCPFGNCEKKFSAVVGLKYHQTSSHRNVICKMSHQHSNYCSDAKGLKRALKVKKQELLLGQTSKDPGATLENKPNLEDLFKTAQAKQAGQEQQTSSPVYSDISEDDAAAAPPLQPVLDDAAAPTATLPQHASAAANEKPMAIVEPQCASAASSIRPTVLEQHSTPTALCAPKPGQTGARPGKDSQGVLEKHSSMCPPLLPSLESSIRSTKCGIVGKLEAASPRPTSVALEFAVPAPPRSTAIESSLSRQSAASAQHQINFMNQLNHQALMLNPFNPTSAAAMFPGGQVVPQGVFQAQGLGLDSAAAALISASQAAGIYGSSAALAAAGFPMGLQSPPGGSHPGAAGLYGSSPVVSMASAYGSRSPDFSPSAVAQLGSGASSYHAQSGGATSVARLQQAHKIHELTEHTKRAQSMASDAVIVEALRRSRVANMSPSTAISSAQGQRARQLTPALLDPEYSQRPASRPAKLPAPASLASAALPISVIASTVNQGLGSKHQQVKGNSPTTRTDLLSVSPPVQRHLHTHHHTHTTYPALLATGMDPYSAMVASQQAAAAAASVVSGYAPFGSSAKP